MWSAALLQISPRLTRTRKPKTDKIIYNDAATNTRIIAAIIINPATFSSGQTLGASLSIRVGKRRVGLFASTALIYGLEIPAVLFEPLSGLNGINVTCYADNDALEALVSNAPGPPVIAAMAQLIWPRIAELNMEVWPERATSRMNISGHPTKLKLLPLPSRWARNSKCRPERYEIIILRGAQAIQLGQHILPIQWETIFFSSEKMEGRRSGASQEGLAFVIQSRVFLSYLISTAEGQISDTIDKFP